MARKIFSKKQWLKVLRHNQFVTEEFIIDALTSQDSWVNLYDGMSVEEIEKIGLAIIDEWTIESEDLEGGSNED